MMEFEDSLNYKCPTCANKYLGDRPSRSFNNSEYGTEKDDEFE